jgi:beta-galactosidase
MIRFMRRRSIFVLAFIFSFNSFARESSLLDSGWRFMQGDSAGLAGQAMSPADANWIDSNWQTVSIPHCWGWEEAQQGNTNYYRGPGWYRRELDVLPQKSKRYFLRFEAASSVADVYVNGNFIGEHRGAFGAFCFEVTTNLSASGTNLLAVRVSNAPENDIAPLSGDFPFYGGLYRPVHLIETEANYFVPTDHGSPGVAWLQTSIGKKQARLDVTAQIANGTGHPETLSVIASVFDAAGNFVAGNRQSIFLTTNTTEVPCRLRIDIPRPHLWNGRADPYLYRAVVELRSTNKVWDAVEQQIGLRFYSIDPDKGFSLNGKPYSLHGVDKHQDRWNQGWAVSETDLDEDIALIKELGATVIRCAHYQHSDYFYSLCDQAGILVWAEIPQVNEINPSEQFEETSRNQLLDLIRQNVNHPSIFVWSLFNELRPGKPDPHRELQDLKIVANGEDPTRPTIGANFTDQLPQMAKIPDQLGWNHYPGWYAGGGSLTNFSAWLDKVRYTSRGGGFCVSEYGAGANISQHEQFPEQPAATNQWHPEEWQAIVHERDWAILKTKPFVWATFAWCMFDFTSPARHEGGVPGRNDKGLVTADRKIKKDAFYFYKANWSDEPVLYITDRRFNERTNAVTDVKIYSNAKKVELLLNGISQGRRSDGTNCVFIWQGVKLSPGENRVEARAKRDGKNLSDGCVWNLH